MLQKQNRLIEERDFRRVVAKGRAFFIRECGIKALKDYRQDSKNRATRIGIVVPKKLARTVVKRNRVKRQVRHIFLSMLPNMAVGYDIVFIARAGFIELTCSEMKDKIRLLLQKTSLLNQIEWKNTVNGLARTAKTSRANFFKNAATP
ncbi:MAG: ribonuclease P protein component [Candidatus Jacksonbacteria bacterium]|nr:ribonuclease P protein component [Candidatus Jacksonbacteria bacterium]